MSTGPAGFRRGARRPAPTHPPQSEPLGPDSQEAAQQGPQAKRTRAPGHPGGAATRPATGAFQKETVSVSSRGTAKGKHQPWRPHPHPDCPRLGAHGGAVWPVSRRFSPGPLLHLRAAAGASRPFFLAAEESPTSEGLQTKRFWSLAEEKLAGFQCSRQTLGAYTQGLQKRTEVRLFTSADGSRPRRSATTGEGGLWRGPLAARPECKCYVTHY